MTAKRSGCGKKDLADADGYAETKQGEADDAPEFIAVFMPGPRKGTPLGKPKRSIRPTPMMVQVSETTECKPPPPAPQTTN